MVFCFGWLGQDPFSIKIADWSRLVWGEGESPRMLLPVMIVTVHRRTGW